MKKIHLALSTRKLAESVKDYSQRLGCEPDVVVPEQYALWRTDTINLSIRVDHSVPAGALRHLGWEDPAAPCFQMDTDVNGIVWERFSASQQADEINEFWPQTGYVAKPSAE